jgi:hypothetical protein
MLANVSGVPRNSLAVIEYEGSKKKEGKVIPVTGHGDP